MRRFLKIISVCIIILVIGLAVSQAIHSPGTFWNVNATGIFTAIFAFLFTFFGADELERVRKINEIYKKMVFDFLQDVEQAANGLDDKNQFYIYKRKLNNKIHSLRIYSEKCGVSELASKIDDWYDKWEKNISENLHDFKKVEKESRKFLDNMKNNSFDILFKL